MNQQQAIKGGSAALISWVLISIFTIVFEIAATDVHPLLFITQAMIIGSLLLISVAGPGNLAIQTVREPTTWLYGVFYLLGNVLLLHNLVYISATEATLLGRLTVAPQILITLCLFRQNLGQGAIGFLFACIGSGIIVSMLEPEIRVPVTINTLIMTAIFAGQYSLGQIHKANNQATTIPMQMRVVGYVLTATALVIIAFMGVAALLGYSGTAFAPTYDDLTNSYAVALALFYGLGMAAIRYTEFVSTKSIGAHNYVAFGVLNIAGVIGLEYFLYWSDPSLVAPPSFDMMTILAITLIIAASLAVLFLSGRPVEEEKLLNIKQTIDDIGRKHEEQYQAWLKKNETEETVRHGPSDATIPPSPSQPANTLTAQEDYHRRKAETEETG